MLGLMGVPLVSSEWSFAQVKVPAGVNMRICSVKNDCLRIASTDGKLYQVDITTQGGEIQIEREA